MTATFQPYVRIAVFYEECNKRLAARDVMLRPANPITYGSACMMSNVLTGGIPFIALTTGGHAESVVGMTWVTPEGEILKTGSSALPNVGDVPVLGPGPDMGGMFLAAEGSFGICTEMTLKLYTENPWPRDRTFYFHPADPLEDDLTEVAEFFYRITRDNYLQAWVEGAIGNVEAMKMRLTAAAGQGGQSTYWSPWGIMITRHTNDPEVAEQLQRLDARRREIAQALAADGLIGESASDPAG